MENKLPEKSEDSSVMFENFLKERFFYNTFVFFPGFQDFWLQNGSHFGDLNLKFPPDLLETFLEYCYTRKFWRKGKDPQIVF